MHSSKNAQWKKVDWIESNEAINTRRHISETNKPGAISDGKCRRILDHSDTFCYSRKAYVLYFITSAIVIGPEKELVHKTKESVFLIKLMPISKFFDETELVRIDLYVMSNFEHEDVSFHTLKGN